MGSSKFVLWREAILVCKQDCFATKTVLSDRELGACSAYSRAKSAPTTFFKFNVFRLGQLEVFCQPFTIRMCLPGWQLVLESPYVSILALGSVALGIVISPLNALMDQQVTHSVGVIPFPINVYCICHLPAHCWCF